MSTLNDPLVLRDFAKVMEDAGIVEDSKEVLVKPYKFEREFSIWQNYDYPDQTDTNWDEFAEALQADDEEEEEEGE
jgi:hypothetical protein